MIPIDAASLIPKLIDGTRALRTRAPTNVKNTPNCAAAPEYSLDWQLADRVCHTTDTDENKRRINTKLNSEIQ